MKKLKKQIFNDKILLWAGLFLILALINTNNYLDSDEGIILEGAWNLINNRSIYVDFFSNRTPGAYFVVYTVWKIFGVNYFVTKFFCLLFVFFSAVGTYKIAEKIYKSRFNFLIALGFIVASTSWPIINHNTLNIFFVIWAVYVFMLAIEQSRFEYYLLSGFLTGLAIIFLQHKGLALLFVLSSFLLIITIIKKQKAYIKPFFIFLSASAIPVACLFLFWPYDLLYRNLIGFNVENYLEKNKVSLFLFILLFIIYLAYVQLLKKEKSKKIWLLFYLQLILLLSALTRPDYYHLSLIIFPLYALTPFTLKKLNNINSNIKPLYYSLISIFILVVIFVVVFSLALFPPLATIKTSKTVKYINDNCSGDYLYAGPFQPGLYPETKKLNPTRYSVLITGIQTEEQFEEAKESLELFKPTCAVMNYAIVAKFSYDKNNPVDNYIRDHYTIVLKDNNTLVYKRK